MHPWAILFVSSKCPFGVYCTTVADATCLSLTCLGNSFVRAWSRRVLLLVKQILMICTVAFCARDSY